MRSDVGVSLRTAEPRDERAIRALLGRCYPDNPKTRPDVYRWQYCDNPYGRALSVVAESGGALVGHVAALPLPLLVDGRRRSGVVGVDAAVDPGFRGRELTRAMLVERAAELDALGAGPTLSFPSATRPTRALLSSGASAPLRLRLLARPVMGRSRRKPGGTYVTSEADCVPPEIDELWSSTRPSAGCTIDRDLTWWRWRFESHPDRPYSFVTVRRRGRLVGALAWRWRWLRGRHATVMALIALDDDAARHLVRALSDVVAARRARRAPGGIVALAHPGDPHLARMERAGLLRIPAAVQPRAQYFMVTGDVSTPRLTWSVQWDCLDHL